MTKLFSFGAALVVAFLAASSPAHAEVISLTIGNAIFAGLYSIGIPGAIANFVAVNALGIAAIGGSVRASFR